MDNKEYSTATLLRRFFPYYRRHGKVMALDLFCSALTTLCELVLPMILRKITNTAMNDLASLTVSFVGKAALLYLALRVIDCFANYYRAYEGHVMGVEMETDMRRDAYAHLQRLSTSFYNNTKVGQIMGRITNDLFDVTEFAHHCPEEFFVAAIKIVVSFAILATINVPLTLMIFAVVPVMVFVCVKLNRKNRKAFAAQRVQIGELNANIEDSLLGNKVVKAFANEPLEIAKFGEGNEKFHQIKRKTYRYMAAFQTSVIAFDGLMYLLIILAGGVWVTKGYITAGDLVAYTLYVGSLITTIRRIIEFAEQFQRGITGIERFLQIMDAEIEIFDEPDAVEMPKPEGKIEFSHVSFEYPDDHNIVFHDLNLTVRAGEHLAIVGPSGGGKTTLCNLIPRFFDVDEGSISIDGSDIRRFTLRSLRQQIGIVQQDVYLFSGTVMENILYGRPGATREEAIEAAKKAGAHEFITRLREGYDSYVGERGVKLSGGQKQRISIARVFLKDPPILLLDEATSALDNESEFVVAKALSALSRGRTSITIAHRLSTIQNADRILVLREDGIAEEGTHQSLMAQKGMYYDYYTMSERMQNG
ncbi:MAG: ABC transporter ATP-binding protein [Lachnospiraceae bacterium]|nr:ABC transporter ATP-binding protein [Lachnospiraceae bacterium]